MNIERWLYPKPEIKWSPKDYDGEIVWIPVYKQSSGFAIAKEKEQIVNLQTLNAREDDGIFPDPRPSFTTSTFSSASRGESHIYGRFKVEELQENIKFQEVNKIYRTSLGLPEIESQSTQHFSNQSRFGVITTEAASPGLFDTLFGSGKTDSIKPALPKYTSETMTHRQPVGSARRQQEAEKDVLYRIPCMFHKQNQYQSKVLIYFHSNAEDIHLSYNFCRHLMVQLNVCVLAVEYPGYSCFSDQETSEELICENAERVFDFLVHDAGIAASKNSPDAGDIYVLGRSIGTTPAIHLATKRMPGMLILVSPFMSIKVASPLNSNSSEITGEWSAVWGTWS